MDQLLFASSGVIIGFAYGLRHISTPKQLQKHGMNTPSLSVGLVVWFVLAQQDSRVSICTKEGEEVTWTSKIWVKMLFHRFSNAPYSGFLVVGLCSFLFEVSSSVLLAGMSDMSVFEEGLCKATGYQTSLSTRLVLK